MATLTGPQQAAVAAAAGFTGRALVVGLAVWKHEGGWRTDAIGDQGIAGRRTPDGRTWGPSVSTAQVRSIVEERGTGGVRDAEALLDPAFAMRSAYAIFLEAGGTAPDPEYGEMRGFRPWSSYTNGRWRQYVPEATAAVQAVPTGGAQLELVGTPGDVATIVGPDSASDTLDVAGLAPPDLGPVARLEQLTVRGVELGADLADAVTSFTVSAALDRVTSLELEVIDPGLEVLATGLLARGAVMRWRNLEHVVDTVDVGGGPAGTGALGILTIPRAVRLLRDATGPNVLRNISSADYVKAGCEALGIPSVVQGTPTRSQVSRDVAAADDPETGPADRPSEWSTFERLAAEDGMLLFEVGGTVYYVRPSWLVEQQAGLETRVGWLGEPEATRALELPAGRQSDSAEAAAELSLAVPYDRAGEFAPGRAVKVAGLPTFVGTYLVAELTIDGAAGGRCDVRLTSPIDPTPAGIGTPAGEASLADRLVAAGGDSSAQVERFIAELMGQLGKPYRFGIEVRPGDPSPPGFDCSEIIEWACARVGVTFADGSSNQYAAGRRAGLELSVADAVRTRGAILYKLARSSSGAFVSGTASHAAVSLGDGTTIDARGGSARKVGIFPADSVAYNVAALIPGMDYGR